MPFGELLFPASGLPSSATYLRRIDSLGDGSAIDPAALERVIIDEAHHAAANSWHNLLERVAPKELIGILAHPSAQIDRLDAASHAHGSETFRVLNAIRTR